MDATIHSRNLGLALSGGGSRAAAFHRGTFQGLLDLELVDRIDVVSTVSGGSLFGGAWMAARMAGTSDGDFLKSMGQELEKGFILRSIRPRLLKTLIPGNAYSRTNALADTFDSIFFRGEKLGNLPTRPQLFINTTVMNNGQVGKFSRLGFSAIDLYLDSVAPPHQIPMPEFRIALAVGASAAFPIGLPPVELTRKHFPERIEFRGSLKGTSRLALTDGGVLENLGIQTLLASKRFGTWDMVVSDAGTADKPWAPGSPINPLRSLGVWVLSGRALDRIMLIMNSKQNRWARQQVFAKMQSSWFADALRAGDGGGPGLPVLTSGWPALPRRNVLFVRVNQDWSRFMRSIEPYRLEELGAGHTPLPNPKNEVAVERFLSEAGVNLSKAKDYYQALGGDDRARALNDIPTNFTALSADDVVQLAAHAAWQVHATHAIYGL
jgi:predicted acylesterase/phospholipase RssA